MEFFFIVKIKPSFKGTAEDPRVPAEDRRSAGCAQLLADSAAARTCVRSSVTHPATNPHHSPLTTSPLL